MWTFTWQVSGPVRLNHCDATILINSMDSAKLPLIITIIKITITNAYISLIMGNLIFTSTQ